MMNRAEPGPNLDVRLRTMRILWVIFIINVGLFALLCYFAAPNADSGRAGLSGATGASAQFPTLLVLFFVLAVVVIALSFVIKPRFMSKAVRERRVEHVQAGMIVALVLCETSALFGVMTLFLFGNRYSYLLFVVAAAAMLLHMPRREDLLAASYKSGGASAPGEF